MANINRANRQVCDVDIRILDGKKPFLKFNTANTTTAGLSSDSVYAMAKGARRIAFSNPLDGTMTIEAQVYPFKLFALLSDGVIHTNAAYADSQTITATAEGSLSISVGSGTIATGTVFVYPEDSFGDEDAMIAGTYASGTFTATSAGNIVAGKKYEVGYLVTRNAGVRRISFNNNNLPQDYYITMKTVDKDENGVLTPFIMTAYKATIQRSFELSFSSEGDPASVTLTFDLMEDKDGNTLDMLEIIDEAMTVSVSAISVVKGEQAPDIAINNAVGKITVTSTNPKVTAVVSGDSDRVIISAASDATAGNCTITLTDEDSQTATIAVTVKAS